MIYLPVLQRHRHPEAFMLLRYESPNKQVIEHVWNSRDGVTPFGIFARDGKTLLYCINLMAWVYQPEYRPQPGDRIFVSHTAETVWQVSERNVLRHWDSYYPPHGQTQGQMIAEIAKSFKVGSDPLLVTWTGEGWQL